MDKPKRTTFYRRVSLRARCLAAKEFSEPFACQWPWQRRTIYKVFRPARPACSTATNPLNYETEPYFNKLRGHHWLGLGRPKARSLDSAGRRRPARTSRDRTDPGGPAPVGRSDARALPQRTDRYRHRDLARAGPFRLGRV